MALSQHDLLRLLESLRSADGLELVRNVAERMLQELIEAEATARIGAEWNEHTETRTALRNGHRDKTLSTQAGDLDLAIPKLRSGSFFPALLERRRRIDQALYAVKRLRACVRRRSRTTTMMASSTATVMVTITCPDPPVSPRHGGPARWPDLLQERDCGERRAEGLHAAQRRFC
jgi:hypothetical protein